MSEQVEVEITATVVTARYGNLTTRDVLRTDKAFADHLVKECGAAKYRNANTEANTKANTKAGTKAKSKVA